MSHLPREVRRLYEDQQNAGPAWHAPPPPPDPEVLSGANVHAAKAKTAEIAAGPQPTPDSSPDPYMGVVLAMQRISGSGPGSGYRALKMDARTAQTDKKRDWQPERDAEIDGLRARGTYTIEDATTVDGPIIRSTWVYKTKMKDDGKGNSVLDKHKARLCARGDTQQYGTDFDHTWAPVAKFAIMLPTLQLIIVTFW